MVLRAQNLGFTLGEISDAILLAHGEGLQCGALIEHLTGKLVQVNAHIEQTMALRSRLVALIKELQQASPTSDKKQAA